MSSKLKHDNRRLTDAERARQAMIRAAAARDFPPKAGGGRRPAPAGIAAQIRRAREAQGLTWYALAKLARIPNQGTVRAIEQGQDTKLSNLQAVAAALGLRLGLVEQTA